MAAMRDELSACRLARIPQIPIIPKIDPRRFISPSRFTGFVAWLKRMRNRQTPLSRARAHYATLAQLFLDYFTMNFSRSMRSSTRWEPTRKGPEPNVRCLEKDWTHSNIALLPTLCILTGGNVYLCCTRELDIRSFAESNAHPFTALATGRFAAASIVRIVCFSSMCTIARLDTLLGEIETGPRPERFPLGKHLLDHKQNGPCPTCRAVGRYQDLASFQDSR